MTSNRYVTNTPKATVVSPLEPLRSATCEVPGCRSLYLGRDGAGREHFAPGKTHLYVHDGLGNDRAICADHYLRGLVRAGKHSNQDLVDRDGRIDITKFRAMQQRLQDEDLEFIPHERVVA